MLKIKIRIEILDLMLRDKDLLKQFMILNQFRSSNLFPIRKVTALIKIQLSEHLKVSKRTINNYLKIIKTAELLEKNQGYINLRSNRQFFVQIKPELSSMQYIIVDFDPVKPKQSIFLAYIIHFLKKQEHQIIAKLEISFSDIVAARNRYNEIIASISYSTYNPHQRFQPPMLTQKAISDLLGFKSSTSGYLYKKLFVRLGSIEIKQMKKQKRSFSNNKRGQTQQIGNLMQDFLPENRSQRKMNFKNPPDFAVIKKMQKIDSS
jgi:hypothetical protein